jgi:transposase
MSPRILTEQERTMVAAVAMHPGDTTVLRRAQALLWRDEGESIAEVGERLGVSRRTICYWQAHFRERQALELTARLGEGHRSGRPRTAAGIIDPLLESVLDQDPRELGYRSTVWTAPLLRQYLEDVHDLSVSRQSVSLALVRLRIRWKRPRHHLALRAPRWRQAKGGSNAGSRSGSARCG